MTDDQAPAGAGDPAPILAKGELTPKHLGPARQGRDADIVEEAITRDEWRRRQAEHAIPAERLGPQGRAATRRSR